MTTYNSKIYMQQGGSEQTVESGGSISISAGGVLANSGKQTVSGTQEISSGGSLNVVTGGILDAQTGAISFNSGHRIYFGTATPHNSVSASPGSVYFRSDGVNSNVYINVASGTAGQSWKSACIVD